MTSSGQASERPGGEVQARGIGGRAGSRLERLLGDGLRPIAPLRGLSGSPQRVVAAVSEEARITELEAAGVELDWSEPVTVGGLRELLSRSRERGRASVEIVTERPALLGSMQLGSWFDAPWRTRLLRRARLLHWIPRLLAGSSTRWLGIAADLAFWDGARRAASGEQWRRWTRQSYSVLVYHRFSGALAPGQERIDIAPARFRRQLRALRLCGFHPISPAELLEILEGTATARRRSVLITVDDAIADCIDPLTRSARWHPQLYAPTAEVGGAAHWLDDAPRVASWQELRSLEQAGVGIGSHADHHRRVTELSPQERDLELTSSRQDLAAHLASPLPLLAFPNGAHDLETCTAAEAAGYRAAFTTEKGRNGAGADAFTLRRVSIHGHDGALAALWKASTGEGLPGFWLRLRELL